MPAASTATAPKASDEPLMSTGRLALFSVGAMAAMLLSLLDENIVATAALPITSDLDPEHGMSLLPWLLSVYLLAATATQPLYGKLSDLYGPKKVYLFAIVTFMAGSALCGIAQNMGQLIAFRAVQGLGGGGLMSLTLIIMATLYPPKERAGGSGVGGGLVALGIIVGPLLGGYLSQHLSWRWIFYVNLPLGLLTVVATLFALRLPPRAHQRERRVDLPGAALVTAAAAGLLLIAQWGGTEYAWSSPQILGLSAGSLLLVAAFAWWETRAAEPILPPSLFRDPVFRIAAPLQFLAGFTVLAVTAYVVTYLQVARGLSAQSAGQRLAPMAIGVIVVMFSSGKLISRTLRYKPVLLLNSAITVITLALFGTVDETTSALHLGVLLVLLGFGLGGVVQVVLQTVQASAPPEQLGVATTGTRFFMTLGSGFGVAVLGELLNNRFLALLPDGVPESARGSAGKAVAALRTAPPDLRDKLTHAYASAVDTVFLTAAGLMLLALVLAFLMPDVRLGAADEQEA
ncbi:MFS transporter [Streptomyces sp. WAC 01529]|uniref:MFS transporter n=1 Tax=Streptomyces sp. WAC 01529 TaxID=2203205 RepID=UPI000F6FD4D3|nr:MFS transporter [Streptomyces sp. WAC 01529]AZM55049.1 MFS transporter [Streptomyces sp. WAC 01529]